jgi:hypothetical protein
LRLTISRHDERFSPEGLTEIHTWLDLSGRICARGYVGAGARWMVWPGVVAFRFDERGHIDAIPEPTATDAQVRDLCRRSVEPIIRQALGDETLHASAVRCGAGVVAFCGERESGKSTLAYSLSQRSFTQYADDTVVMHVEPERVRALDLPFGVRLRPETATFYGFDVDGPAPLHDVVPLTESNDIDVAFTPLAAVFVLSRKPAGPPSITRLAPSAAFTAILAHAHCFNPDDPQERRRLLENYLTIGSVVPVFDLRFSAGLDRLDALLGRIEETVGALQEAARCA